MIKTQLCTYCFQKGLTPVFEKLLHFILVLNPVFVFGYLELTLDDMPRFLGPSR